jgi:uncharacterized membrane protein YbhN (UPF0104 family)
MSGIARHKVRRFLVGLATTVVVAALATYVWRHRQEMAALLTAQPGFVLGLLALQGIRNLVRGMVDREVLRARGIRLRVAEAGCMIVVAGASDLFLPEGGTVARAMYLKQRHGLGYLTFVQAMLGVAPARWSIDLLLAVTCFLPVLSATWRGPWLGWGIASAISAALVCMFVVLPWMGRRWPWWHSKVQAVAGGWLILWRQPVLLLRLCGWLLLVRLVQASVLWCGAMAIGANLTIVQSAAVSIVTIMATAVSIVPSGLGITEAVTSLSGTQFGLRPVEGVAIALLIRAGGIVGSSLGGPAAAWYLGRQLSKNGAKRDADFPPPAEDRWDHSQAA